MDTRTRRFSPSIRLVTKCHPNVILHKGKQRTSLRKSQLPVSGHSVVCRPICGRCTANLAHQTRRCQRKSCRDYRFCSQHLRTIKKLVIAPSRHLIKNGLQGLGLYAVANTRPYQTDENGTIIRDNEIIFRTNEVIDEYCGELLTQQELDDRYDEAGVDGLGSYTLELGTRKSNSWKRRHPRRFVDAQCAGTAAVYANDYRNLELSASSRSNARLEDDTTTHGRLVASRNIHHGEEILVNYGKEYFR